MGFVKKLNHIRPSLEKKTFFSGYSTTMVGTSKKVNLHSVLPENIYFRFRPQYYYDACDLEKKKISLVPHRKIIFSRAQDIEKKFNQHSTLLRIFFSSVLLWYCTAVLLWCTGLQRLLFGIMLMFITKHVDPIQKAFGWKNAWPKCWQLEE